MPMSPRLLRPRASSALVATDADAKAYINAVRTADGGQYMEAGVQRAIDAFITGCKADGIWTAIKASCILMGARTLSGALTPLVGTAPTNNNFVSGDYDRKTGLKGNGSTKNINTNRNNNVNSQDNVHASVYVTGAITIASARVFFGSSPVGTSGGINLYSETTDALTANCIGNPIVNVAASQGVTTGLKGVSRSASGSFVLRSGGSDTTATSTGAAPASGNIYVFDRGPTPPHFPSDGRFSFYSIGESLTLSLLDSRVTTLYNAIGAAI